MKTNIVKNIWLIGLGGAWDDEENRPNGAGFGEDHEYEWRGSNLIAKKIFKPVLFSCPSRYHLKQQHGKKNSLTRPFVYTDASCSDSTITAWDKWHAKWNALVNELNETIDTSKPDHLDDQGGYCFKMLTLTPEMQKKAGEICKKHGLENVWTQVKQTPYISSYTPEEIEAGFVRIA